MPVFQGLEYKIGVINPEIKEVHLLAEDVFMSVTCVGNFIQPDVCRQYLQNMNGPVVFGEIAYQLMGQTTVYLKIDDVNKEAAL
jgi:hypothetical protein